MPLDPVVTGSLIGAGANLLGGLFGSSSNRSMMRDQLRYQREFAQHGIRWRVEDAKAAGLHPLYAMGAQVTPYSPTLIPDSVGPALAEAGQNIGRAVAATQTAEERMMTQLTLEKARKDLAETDARIGLLESERLRNLTEAHGKPFPAGGGAFTFAMGDEGTVYPSRALPARSNALPVGLVDLRPPDLPLAASHAAPQDMAGVPPLWREYQLAPGRKIALPGGVSGDVSESLETLSESAALMAMVLSENDRRFGKGWTDWFMDTYYGAPVSRWIDNSLEGMFGPPWKRKKLPDTFRHPVPEKDMSRRFLAR